MLAQPTDSAFTEELFSFELPGTWTSTPKPATASKHYTRDDRSMELMTISAIAVEFDRPEQRQAKVQTTLDEFRTLAERAHKDITFSDRVILSGQRGIWAGLLEWQKLLPEQRRACAIVFASETTFVAMELTEVRTATPDFGQTIAGIVNSFRC
jgi:hypothetical protein